MTKLESMVTELRRQIMNFAIPEHMREAIEDYVIEGRRKGSFLTALFSNEFARAVVNADEYNLAAIDRWAKFLYNGVPSQCWGSSGAVDEWIRKGGLRGFLALNDAAPAGQGGGRC